MFTKIQISDELTFYTNDDLNVQLDENDINLGLMVEVLDIVEATGEGDENYPYIVSIGLMTKKPHESFNETDGDITESSLLYDCNGYMGSIPVDHILTAAVNGGMDELIKLFNVSEAKLVIEKRKWGTVAAQNGPDSEFKYLMFSSEESAQKFVDFIINNRAGMLTMMVGFILDRPINMIGNNGWGQIETMVNGK